MNNPEPWDPAEWETELVEILPHIQVENGPLEFEEQPEENHYRITQETRFRIPPELLADLQPWQADLLHRAFERYQDETREQLHAAVAQLGRTGRAYIAPPGADPRTPEGWQELGYINGDGYTLDHQPTYWDEIHEWRNPAPISITLENISEETRALIMGPPEQWQLHAPTWQQPPRPLEPAHPDYPPTPPRQWKTPYPLLTRLRLRWEHEED